MADSRGVRLGVAALILSTAATSLGITGGTAGAGPASVARSYYAAYNKYDGKTMCRLFTPELSYWFVHLPGFRRNLTCPRIAAGLIGYGEESDTPLFRKLKVLSVAEHVDGDSARVTVKARFNYKHFPRPVTIVFKDQLYFVKRGTFWRLVKPGGVWFLTASAYSTPETMLDPPLTDAEAHLPAPQPPPAFECSGKPAGTMSDPAGDAPASLDVRRASAMVEADGSVCIRLAFESEPRPGTVLVFKLEQDQPSLNRAYVTEPVVRIGTGGSFFFSVLHHPPDEVPTSLQAGWRDGELYVRWDSSGSRARGPYTLRFGGTTKTLQPWEPLVHSPLLGRGDEPFEGRGDSFGRAG